MLAALAISGASITSSNALIRGSAPGRVEGALGGCVELSHPSLSIPGGLLAVDLLQGRFRNVSFESHDAELAGLRVESIKGSVKTARVPLLRGGEDVELRGAHLIARVGQRDIDRLVQTSELGVAIRLAEGQAFLDVGSGAASIPLEVRADRGALEVGAQRPFASLFRIRFALPGIRFRQVAVAEGALRVRATMNGDPRTIACSAERVLRVRLRAISRVAEAASALTDLNAG